MCDTRYFRRPGRRYRSYGNDIVASLYFTEKSKSTNIPSTSLCTDVRKVLKWIPPRSPYCLVQEDLYSDPWQLLVATIFLTKTSAERAIPQALKFLHKFPTPDSLLNGEHDRIIEFLTPLGLENLRTSILLRFTREYLTVDWKYPIELHGIGKYGNDSYRIFCCGEWRETIPDDIPLNLYRNWLIDNCDKLGL